MKYTTAVVVSVLVATVVMSVSGHAFSKPASSATIVPRKSFPPSPTPSPTIAPILIMSVGDSLSDGLHGGTGFAYRQELSRLLNLSGIPHTWNVQAVGGTKCSYWATNLASKLDLYHPNLIFLDCGTNDTPTDNTETDYNTILNAAAARGIPVVASLIGVPDMQSPTNVIRPDIINWMHNTNLAIKRSLATHTSVPFADFQRIPHNLEWLQNDGIHLTARADMGYGQLFYQAAQPTRPGWKTFAQIGIREMCGLNGSYPGDSEPIPDINYNVCNRE